MNENKSKFGVWIGITALFPAFFFLNALRPIASEVEMENFIVKRGDRFQDIIGRLEINNIIRSASAANIYGALNGSHKKIQPGRYELNASLGTKEVLRILTDGQGKFQEALIPEGATLLEIDALLSSRHILEAGEILSFSIDSLRGEYEFLENSKTLEGFLFPDTYRFSFYSDPEVVARAFLDNFNKKAWPLLSGDTKWKDTLIIASMLEKEVRAYEERRLVAGIISKRLREGIPLQIDATIVYGKCGGYFSGCKKLIRDDFDIVSPFNTYKRKGLPPVPIGNPGADTLRAASSPRASSYFYYLTDPETGKAFFSETFDAHNEKRARYLGL